MIKIILRHQITNRFNVAESKGIWRATDVLSTDLIEGTKQHDFYQL